MSSSPDGLPNRDDKKRTRRTRKDMTQRNYTCKYCTKGYLSNAALYTHVKIKHEGPKQENGIRENHEPEENQRTIIAQSQANKNGEGALRGDNPQVDKQCHLDKLRNLLRKYFPQRNKSTSAVQIVEGLGQEQRKLFEPLLSYWSEETEPPTQKQSICINYVLAYFLHLMSKKLGAHCLQFLIRFFFNFRLGLVKETRKNSICEKMNAGVLPNYFNQIIMNGYITQANNADEFSSNSDLVCRIIQCFGDWLYAEKFTNYKIIANF